MTSDKMRSYARDITLTLGLLSANGSLYNIGSTTSDVEYKLLCPTCGANEPHSLTQSYVCAKGHAATQSECGRGIEEPKNDAGIRPLRWISDYESLSLARTLPDSYVKGHLNLNVVDADAFNNQTYPTKGSYVFVAAKQSPFLAGLRTLLDGTGRMFTDDGDRVIIGNILLQGAVKLVRLQTWNGHLVLQEMLHFEDVKVLPSSEDTIDAANVEIIRQLVQSTTVELSSIDLTDPIRAIDNNIVQNGVTIVPSVPDILSSESELFSLLSKSLAAAKTPKKPTKSKKVT